MAETIETDEIGQIEAARRIEEIMNDIYGSNNVDLNTKGRDPVVKAPQFNDRVVVGSRGNLTVIGVGKSQATTISRVRQMVSGETRVDDVPVEEAEDMEFLEERFGDNNPHGDEGAIREVNSDGSIEFLPPFSKEQANYFQPGGGEHDARDCQDCSHYIEGGGCHVVQGSIHPEGHCESFYADVGFFGRYDRSTSDFVVNMVLWGERFESRARRAISGHRDRVQSVVDAIETKVSDRIG